MIISFIYYQSTCCFRSFCYAGLAGLAVLAGGEAAHIAISDGRVLALKLYSTLPGSKSKKKKGIYITIIITCMTAWNQNRLL